MFDRTVPNMACRYQINADIEVEYYSSVYYRRLDREAYSHAVYSGCEAFEELAEYMDNTFFRALAESYSGDGDLAGDGDGEAE